MKPIHNRDYLLDSHSREAVPMNDTPSKPDRPAKPQGDSASDTSGSALEATSGSQPVPIPDPALPVTLPSQAPNASSATPHRDPGRIGKYVVIRKVGKGGMGSVYEATDATLDRNIAIKTMKPEDAANQANRERFLREARAAAAVKSDYIVPIWDFGETDDGTPYIVMPILEGEMLAARLEREPVAAVGLILRVARDVAEGLVVAHAKGLIHRDIKPSNIWLENDTFKEHVRFLRCKILDFGLARLVARG